MNYAYIKNYYRLIAVNLRKKKQLDAEPKAIQQIEFVEQLRTLNNNGDATDVGTHQNMFALTVLEKIKETQLKFSQERVMVM